MIYSETDRFKSVSIITITMIGDKFEICINYLASFVSTGGRGDGKQ
jgi:hypothetical protein